MGVGGGKKIKGLLREREQAKEWRQMEKKGWGGRKLN